MSVHVHEHCSYIAWHIQCTICDCVSFHFAFFLSNETAFHSNLMAITFEYRKSKDKSQIDKRQSTSIRILSAITVSQFLSPILLLVLSLSANAAVALLVILSINLQFRMSDMKTAKPRIPSPRTGAMIYLVSFG